MSEADQDIIIGRVTRKIILRLVVPVLVIMLGQGSVILLSQNSKAGKTYVEAHYSELYRLTAELSTTMSMYMNSNDKDKDRLQSRMDYLIERMDKYADKDVKRGTEADTLKRKHGLEFTPLI